MLDVFSTLSLIPTGQCDCDCDCACAFPASSWLAPTAPPISSVVPHNPTPKALSAWLHLTDRCNLRCDYCYTAHAKSNMSLAVGRASIDALIRSAVAHGYQGVKLKYAGGEPLLRFPQALALHRYAKSQAAEHGLALNGILLSNGTLLTAEMVTQIRALGLRLMISLDGLGAMHDCQRHYADGQGSFAEVTHAIELARAGGLVPDISITISGRNAGGLPDTVAWILERELPFSLNFYREHREAVSPSDLRLNGGRMLAGMLAAYRVIEAHLPQRCLLGSLADRAVLTAPHLRTCSAGQSYLAFDAQGRVSKCQMDMAHPVTTCYDPDPLGTCRVSEIGLHNPIVDEKDGCRDCDWRYACGGGCPLQTYRMTGSYYTKSPYCSLYQTLLPEVVHLEMARLKSDDALSHTSDLLRNASPPQYPTP
jgi:uncharacterized protein